MYKNCALMLWFSMIITGLCMINLKGIDMTRRLSSDAFRMSLQELQKAAMEEERKETEREEEHRGNILCNETEEVFASGRRIVDYDVLVAEGEKLLGKEDYEILCRIVEAEAGCEDEKGRILVANVVMNRVKSSRFPNSVKAVVFQKSGGTYQFSPLADGRYYNVSVSEATREAVNKVLIEGVDDSGGALFFVNRSKANAEYMYWFDTKCTPLFSYGRHEFFS